MTNIVSLSAVAYAHLLSVEEALADLGQFEAVGEAAEYKATVKAMVSLHEALNAIRKKFVTWEQFEALIGEGGGPVALSGGTNKDNPTPPPPPPGSGG